MCVDCGGEAKKEKDKALDVVFKGPIWLASGIETGNGEKGKGLVTGGDGHGHAASACGPVHDEQ